MNVHTRYSCLTILAIFCSITTVAFSEEPFDTYEVPPATSYFAPQSSDTTCFDSLWSREKLTGDWRGIRPELTDSGITFDGDVTQIYQGVVSGGRKKAFNYGGHGDYRLGLDLGKMNVMQGLSLLVRAEHRFGEVLSRDAGLVAPAGVFAAVPTGKTEDLILTNVLFTQVLSENWIVMFGKMDTLDGDRNPFASGRGKSQFMNTNLVIPIHSIPTVPLATLGAGVIYAVDGLPVAQLVVLNATDTITTSGFDQLFEDGAVITGGVNIPVPVAGKMGIHSFNGAWSSKTFTSLGQDPRVIIGRTPIAASEGSWSVWWSGAQYLYQDPNDPMKGWGLFGRAGQAKGQTNPVEYFLNFGLGGQSPIRGRENDQFGIGWFYNKFSNDLGPIATVALGIGSSSQGIELYYNYAVTPFFRVTPDLQIIEPGSNRANTAVITGLRAEVDF